MFTLKRCGILPQKLEKLCRVTINKEKKIISIQPKQQFQQQQQQHEQQLQQQHDHQQQQTGQEKLQESSDPNAGGGDSEEKDIQSVTESLLISQVVHNATLDEIDVCVGM